MSSITYHGFADFQGRPCVVFKTVDDEDPVEIAGGPFSWGKGTEEDKRDPVRKAAIMLGGKHLATALCAEALGSVEMAERVAVRFQHRKIVELVTGKDFTIRHADLIDAIHSIVETGAGNDEIRKAVDRERPPMATEAGAIAGSPVSEMEKNGVPVSKLREDDL